jgi:hypothetical protein
MYAAVTPRNRDMAVGWKTHAAYTVNRIFPRWSYRVAANIIYQHQTKDAPPAPATTGNLYQSTPPMQVETDIKERMKQEKKAWKKNKK